VLCDDGNCGRSVMIVYTVRLDRMVQCSRSISY
jgi:hypothetical protein